MKSYFKFVKLLKCSTNGFGQFCFQIRLVLMETSTATNCRVCKPYKTPFEHSFILKTEGQWQWFRGMSGCLDFGPLNLKPAGDDMEPFSKRWDVWSPEPPRLWQTWISGSRGGLHGSGAGSRSWTPPRSSSPGSTVPPVDGTKSTYEKGLTEQCLHVWTMMYSDPTSEPNDVRFPSS